MTITNETSAPCVTRTNSTVIIGKARMGRTTRWTMRRMNGPMLVGRVGGTMMTWKRRMCHLKVKTNAPRQTTLMTPGLRHQSRK
eukprot:1000258-Amphidinium_carterae.1